MEIESIPSDVLDRFRAGCVIPAMPLALKADGSFDEISQRALLRYYSDSGAGGLAVGVHSTQFAVRERPGFLQELLTFASKNLDEWNRPKAVPFVKIAGICGSRDQALAEAALAVDAGFHVGLLSLKDLKGRSEKELLDHARAVAEVLPLIGFYLQPTIGGMRLSYSFWKGFASLENVIGVKAAPFNRYATLDVIKGVADSERADLVSLYTGNDDSIVSDFISPFSVKKADGSVVEMSFVGGLLGHWGVWTSAAVRLFETLRKVMDSGESVSQDILRLAAEVTDMNSAVFDAANGFAGCIPGIHEVLYRQGLTESPRCLNSEEILSPGQADEISRVCVSYPHLIDNDFVAEHLSKWRS